MMKIIIFGATGKTGQELIKQCLEHKYTVSVFVRNPEKIEHYLPKITVYAGDIHNEQQVDEAIRGQHAVLVALGVTPGGSDTVLSEGTQYIIKCMKRHKVKRIICITGAGLVENKKHLPLLWRITQKLPLMNSMFTEKKQQEEIIQNSKLDWTIVRPVNLTNDPLTKQYAVDENSNIKLNDAVSRANVAHFMVEQIESPLWIHKKPVIRGS